MIFLHGAITVHTLDVLVVEVCCLLELVQVGVAVSNSTIRISITCKWNVTIVTHKARTSGCHSGVKSVMPGTQRQRSTTHLQGTSSHCQLLHESLRGSCAVTAAVASGSSRKPCSNVTLHHVTSCYKQYLRSNQKGAHGSGLRRSVLCLPSKKVECSTSSRPLHVFAFVIHMLSLCPLLSIFQSVGDHVGSFGKGVTTSAF